MEYGLIGEHLSHSYSRQIHEAFGQYAYELHEVARDNIGDFFARRDFKGINITIPYKISALEAADVLDESARLAGACNCLVNQDGKLIAYNTDYAGIEATFKQAGISPAGKKAAILGKGGAARAVKAFLEQNGAAEIYTVYYKTAPETISLRQLYENHADISILVNATPSGMYPDLDSSPADLTPLKHLEFVMDLIYNPLETRLLAQAKALNIPSAGGLTMLLMQAAAAGKHFMNREIEESLIEEIRTSLFQANSNIVLIGMSSSGKSTLGKELARKLEMDFIDLDEAVVEQTGKKIAQIFEEEGEEAFRALEKEAVKKASLLSHTVIACGGGVITHPENMDRLKKNGVILFLDRDLDLLISQDESRPMLKQGLEKLYAKRLPIYQSHADHEIKNNGTLEEAVEAISQLRDSKKLYERFR